jgi:thiamine pyrophosphate-dependent acetolactate synthase large subunit-like protein
MMKRWEALKVFKQHRGEAIVIHGAGGMNEELRTIDPSELNLYSPMPYPAAAGLGLAMALPKQKVVVMEGDGSALMGMTALPIVGNMVPANLVHVAFDNSAYLSPGTTSTRKHHGPMPTPTAGRASLETLARGSGFQSTCTVETLADFESAIKEALSTTGLRYIVAKVDKEPMPQMSTRMFTTIEQALMFRRALINRGWLSAEHAGMARGKALPGENIEGNRLSIPDIKVEKETGSRPSLEKARTIYGALRAAGINFIVYCPDSANYFIERMASEDPDVTSVAVTREDDGMAIAMAAFMGGRNPAIIMEAAGLGLCSLALAVLAHEQRMGVLILYGHHFALGESRDSHACTRWVTNPLLDALSIPHETLMDPKDAPLIIKQAWRTVRGQMFPVAIGLPLHVLWDE